MSDYARFLESKALVVRSSGRDVEPDAIHPSLFGFQRDMSRWALRKGRAALFESTGLGKTRQQIEWCRLTGERALIVAPLAVAQQTVREGRLIDVPIVYARRQADAAPSGITITNYEMLHAFDPAAFGAVALDECFSKGTKVDTPSGRMHIEELIIGDEILNVSGTDRVSDVHRREVPYAVRITIDGHPITSSPNHPYFTQRGWVGAQDLTPGDEVLATTEAVRLVWDDGHAEIRGQQESAVLRDILLSEMAHEPAGASRQGTHAGRSSEARREAPSLSGVGISGGARGDRADSHAESDGESRDARQGLPPIERDRAQTFRAWGQQPWLDEASTDLAGCARIGLGSGISFVVGQTDSRLSHELQARLGRSRAASQHRSGWSLPLQPEGRRCEAGREGAFARVDRLEVLEPGHPDLERLRDADGKLYFYDLGATRHPSFSVGGLLVHNSSILKNFEGKVRTGLIRAFRDTPYRLCATATPAPNDIAELANHAELLGVMKREEMLATFFVHDDTGWRLKGHAREPFWRWLASWGMSLQRPSDLGYPDDGYALPPLEITACLVPTSWMPPGQLFPTTLKGVTERAALRHDTLSERVKAAADLILSEPDEPWIAWVGLNDEGRELAKLIPGAVLVEGKDSPEAKTEAIERFISGNVKVVISKTSIFGFGLNLQHCARMAFVGLSDSYEAYYQAIRRCWRYGQRRPVHAYIVLTEPEEVIYANVCRKQREAEATAAELVKHVAGFERAEIGNVIRREDAPHAQPIRLPPWLREAM